MAKYRPSKKALDALEREIEAFNKTNSVRRQII